jgi:oligoribonuclease NrnB/cAMP/cGMP phosphodiesterase (DHH superfamily)
VRQLQYLNLAFSHNRDCDGLASGALLLRCLGKDKTKLVLVDYDTIDELIDGIKKAREIGVDRVYVADISLADYYAGRLVEAVRLAVSRGVKIIWLDHHRPRHDLLDMVRSVGVLIHMDATRCSGEIVADVVCGGSGGFLSELARDTDFLVFKHHLSKPLAELISYYCASSKREKLVELAAKMAAGVYWDDEIEFDWKKARKAISREEHLLLKRTIVKEVRGLSLASFMIRS